MQGSLRQTAVLDPPVGPDRVPVGQHGRPTVLICHGGHLRAEMVLGEDLFTEAGYSVLVPSGKAGATGALCLLSGACRS